MKKRRDRKITNWSEYNKGLINRGERMILCIEEDRLESWEYSGEKIAGGQIKFSDICILDLMSIKELHNLGYRQLEGFTKGLLKLLKRIIIQCFLFIFL